MDQNELDALVREKLSNLSPEEKIKLSEQIAKIQANPSTIAALDSAVEEVHHKVGFMRDTEPKKGKKQG